MDKFDIVNGKKLRYGFTTGSCATAGAKAACEMLFNNKKVDFIEIKLVNGELLNIEIEDLLVKDEYVEVAIIKDAGDGYYSIISKCNGLYLDVYGAMANNGTQMQIYEGNGSNAQKFKLEKIETGIIGKESGILKNEELRMKRDNFSGLS